MTKGEKGTGVFEVWKEYESIAMHFNDLILKLRVQALGGTAAITALVGFFSKEQADEFRWGMFMGIMWLLLVFWIAIWILDFLYYNRLLQGAVFAITEVEKKSKTSLYINELNMSQRIEQAARRELPKSNLTRWQRLKGALGRGLFYVIVTVALFGVSYFSTIQYCRASGTESLIKQTKLCELLPACGCLAPPTD